MTNAVTNQRTALASFPRSGNTWVRFLLEKAIGQLCGSIYKDRIMPRGAEGIAIKTHALDSSDYDRAIHIVRNPYDVIESYYHWKLNVAQKKGVDWDDHVRKTVQELREHTDHWLNSGRPAHLVKYEDIKARPAEELEKMVRWLGYEITPQQLQAAVEAGSIDKMREMNGELGQKFFRRGEVGQSYASFTAEQKAIVAAGLRDYLERFGYSA